MPIPIDVNEEDRVERGIECVPDATRNIVAMGVGGAVLGVGLLLTAILLLASLRSVPSGHLGLVVTFGFVREKPLTPGLHVTNPSAEVVPLSVRSVLFEQHNNVPTKEGLLVGLDVALLFHINPDRAYDIFTKVGDNYANIVVAPLLASEIRGLTSQSEAKALYSAGREMIQSNLTDIMTAALAPRGIELEAVLLKAIELPSLLRSSIEAKAQAEQAAERMKYVLQKEEQEADRKNIEATGIAAFQRIVSEGITPSLLQWKGIEATEKFSDSKNSKLVIMGNSKASMPVMLSGDTAKTEV